MKQSDIDRQISEVEVNIELKKTEKAMNDAQTVAKNDCLATKQHLH